MTERFWELMSRYWSREISDTELSELESMLLQHPGDWLKSGFLDKLIFRKEMALPDEATDKLMEKINSKIAGQQAPPHSRWKKMVVSGMAILSTVLLLVLVYHIYYRKNITYKIAATDMGMKTKLRLSDGSIIWLNAGSKLRYPEKFGAQQREVYFSGEGYFEIRSQANKPFIIHTDKMDIRVLGTTLNVYAYDEEDYAETALISGAVEVSMKKGATAQSILLKPHQKAVWKKTDNSISSGNKKSNQSNVILTHQPLSTISEDSTQVAEIAWMHNKLIFHNETLAVLSHRLERWYGIRIVIQNPELNEQRFSGRADNLSIENLLEILREIRPFDYRVQDNIIFIH